MVSRFWVFLPITLLWFNWVKGNIPKVVLFFDDGYYSVYSYAYPLLKKYKMTATLGLISSKVLSSNKHLRNGFLGVAEIKEMIDSLGIEIASHSVNHPKLTDLTDTLAIKYELTHSKQVLESLFGQKVITFAYPYGQYDDRILRLTLQAGYKLGRTCEFGEPNFWVAPLKIPIKEVRLSTNLDEILNHIQKYDVTVLLLHRIALKPRFFTETSYAKFDSLLQALQSCGACILTLRDLYNEWAFDVLEKMVLPTGRLKVRNYWVDYLFKEVDIDQTKTPSRF